MRRAVPDAPNQADKAQVLVVDNDPQAVIAPVMAACS